MGRNGRRLAPRFGTEQLRHGDVGDPQAGVLAEHQLRRCEFGVDDAAPVRSLEGPCGFETDDQRLGGVEKSPTVEEIAKASAAEVLDDPEQGGLGVEFHLAPAEHRHDVGMVERHADFDLPTECLAERRGHGQFRTHDLHRHGPIALGVDGLGDHRVGTGGHHVLDPVPVVQDAPDQAVHPRGGRVGCVGVHSGRNAIG